MKCSRKNLTEPYIFNNDQELCFRVKSNCFKDLQTTYLSSSCIFTYKRIIEYSKLGGVVINIQNSNINRDTSSIFKIVWQKEKHENKNKWFFSSHSNTVFFKCNQSWAFKTRYSTMAWLYWTQPIRGLSQAGTQGQKQINFLVSSEQFSCLCENKNYFLFLKINKYIRKYLYSFYYLTVIVIIDMLKSIVLLGVFFVFFKSQTTHKRCN